jgi:hypothetical protein
MVEKKEERPEGAEDEIEKTPESADPAARPAEPPRSCEHTPEEIEEARKRYDKAHPKKD